MSDWKEKPVTEKQMNLIAEMMEFAEFPIPKFNGKTRGEASDYISNYLSRAHEHFDEYEDIYGDFV